MDLPTTGSVALTAKPLDPAEVYIVTLSSRLNLATLAKERCLKSANGTWEVLPHATHSYECEQPAGGTDWALPILLNGEPLHLNEADAYSDTDYEPILKFRYAGYRAKGRVLSARLVSDFAEEIGTTAIRVEVDIVRTPSNVLPMLSHVASFLLLSFILGVLLFIILMVLLSNTKAAEIPEVQAGDPLATRVIDCREWEDQEARALARRQEQERQAARSWAEQEALRARERELETQQHAEVEKVRAQYWKSSSKLVPIVPTRNTSKLTPLRKRNR